MNNKDFYEYVNRQEPWEREPKSKDLGALMLSEPFTKATQHVLQHAETVRLAVSNTRPTPDRVLDIAFQQGIVAGMYMAFDELIKLTEKQEQRNDDRKPE